MTVPTLDNLPRVPDTHGDNVDERMFSDLYIRTSLVDANVALEQIGAVSETIPFQIISTLRLLFIIVIRGKHICCARSFDVHIFLAVVDLYRELALNWVEYTDKLKCRQERGDLKIIIISHMWDTEYKRHRILRVKWLCFWTFFFFSTFLLLLLFRGSMWCTCYKLFLNTEWKAHKKNALMHVFDEICECTRYIIFV